MKIINSYGAILQKFSGYWIVNEKHLTHKKKDIQQAIKLTLAQSILANQDYNILITGYMQLGLFQKYRDVSHEDLLDPDPKKHLENLGNKKYSENSAKHYKMIDKSNEEQDVLRKEINLLAKVMTDKVKSK